MVDVKQVASEGKVVIEEIAKVEPWLATIIPMIVPAATPAMPLINAFAPIFLTFVARALGDIATANGGDLPSAVIELLQHISKGAPNSKTLSSVHVLGEEGITAG